MLDPNLLRKDLDSVITALQKRKNPQEFLDVAAYQALEAERKTIQTRTEELQNKRNTLSKSIGMLKAKGESVDAVMAETGAIKTELETSAARNDQIAAELQSILMTLPNLPHESVPVGSDEKANVEVRRWGTPKTFDFPVKDHVDVGQPLGLDADTGAKLSGARFTFMKGQVAKLHRALAQFMLDVQTNEHGYTECYTPYIVNREVLEGTGQLPKFEADMFWVTRGGDAEANTQYLISTSEISLTNSVRDSILAESDLPIKL
jgi:seryl-tRNA synthetase